MLGADPPADIEATSWRVSLSASLVRTEVVCQLGGPLEEFDSMLGCSLELGIRYAMSGALTRHIPWMIGDLTGVAPQEVGVEDEVRFLCLRVGEFWSRWAMLRALIGGQLSLRKWKQLQSLPRLSVPNGQYRRAPVIFTGEEEAAEHSVTILIPTLGRYEYLDTLLNQIAKQTIPADQVLVVDQTAPEKRRLNLEKRYQRIPLEVMNREKPGQCSSRNAGLQAATGEYILFLDDDDEIPEDLIENHLHTLAEVGADVCSGVADEVGAGPLPPHFEVFRISDVFPTNNTLVRRSVLQRSGLFDLAYEHGPRADGDLGMRVYLTGALMVLNPEIRVLHHHASVGGLRAHRARSVTYASSRSRLLHRHLPAITEIYYARRYFDKFEVRESLLLRVCGTFASRGQRLKRAVKALLAVLVLPDTLVRTTARHRKAKLMSRRYPQIPELGSAGDLGREREDP